MTIRTLALSTALVAAIGYGAFARPAHASAAGPCFDQPNMAAALASLRSAKASLEKAEHNKGGWRVAADAATSKAIAETERGCAVANR